MRRILLALTVLASLAGCAGHAARMNEGYASPGDLRSAEQRRAAQRDDDRESSHTWSVRDFAYPRGLIW